MCIHFSLHTVERSTFKNKINLLLNCCSEADETLTLYFFAKFKAVSMIVVIIYHGSDLLFQRCFSSTEMYVLYDLGLPPSMSSAMCIVALEALDQFSISRTWFKGPLSVSDARFEGDCLMNWHGGQRTCSSVCWSWALEILWHFITVSHMFSNISSVHFSVEVIYFFPPFFFFLYHWKNKSLTLVPDNSSVATALGGLFPNLLWLLS